jgi:hypothetical protein
MLIYSEIVYQLNVLFSYNLWINLYGKDYLDSYTDVAVTRLNRPDKHNLNICYHKFSGI